MHSDRPLGIGVVGCGFVARDRHLPALRRVIEGRLVAVADRDATARAAAAEAFGAPREYSDAAQLLADPAVEAVAVCVPAGAHVQVAIAALDAGKHVLVEKPLALSLDDADRLIERAARCDRKVMVAFNLRFHRLMRRVREELAAGAIGRVHAVHTVHTGNSRTRPGMQPWLHYRRLGGGSLVEKAVHDFDLWRFTTGGEVDEVMAVTRSGEGEDETVAVSARLSGGVLAVALAGDATAVAHDFVALGSGGSVEASCYRFDGFRRRALDEVPGDPRVRLRDVAASARALAATRGGGVFDASYDAQWRELIAAIREDRQPASTLDDGRRALQVVLAAAQSAATGSAASVDDAPAELAPAPETETLSGATRLA
jgi:predicted dehydrogenase